MGGLQVDGFGARDYFKKIKYLGDHMCPICKCATPHYLENGKMKVTLLWIPTITVKERYAIMCDKCEQGNWIENDEALKIMNGGMLWSKAEDEQNAVEVSAPKCSVCGSEVDGPFCGVCGTKYVPPTKAEEPEEEPIIPICSECGAEVNGAFCSVCGTKYVPPTKTEELEEESKDEWCTPTSPEDNTELSDSNGNEVETENKEESVTPVEEESVQEYTVSTSDWKCTLCGATNSAEESKCSLCSCPKN